MQTPRTPRPQLSGKQLRWIDEYLVDFNGSAAAVRAGYSPKTARSIACELLTKPDIRAVLQARQAVMAKELQITRQGVIRGLLDAVEMGRVQQNPGAMVSALREVAKMLGFFVPEVKRVVINSYQDRVLHNFNVMDDQQLLGTVTK